MGSAPYAIKHKRKKWPWVIALALVVAGAGTAAWLLWGAGTQVARDVTIVEVTPATGNISTSIDGSGNISEAYDEVLLTAGLSFDEVYLAAGDEVVEGQRIARANAESLATAISNLTSELETVTSKLSDLYEGATVQNNITAPATATVSAIYAAPGDSVADVMATYGALMVLQLDSGGELRIGAQTGTVAYLWTSGAPR